MRLRSPSALLLAALLLPSCHKLSGLSDLEFGEADEGGGAGQGGQGEGGGGDAGAGPGGGAGKSSGPGGAAGAGAAGASAGGQAGSAGGAAGGGAGGASAGTGGSGGTPLCLTGDKAPVAEVAQAIVNGLVGVGAVLDASPSSDPEGGPLTYQWEAIGSAPVPADPTQAKVTVVTSECGEYLYKVTVRDACDNQASAPVTLRTLAGPYVSATGCKAGDACGSVARPWCGIQEAIDGTEGEVTLKVADSKYAPIVLRPGVTVEGGYDATFASRNPDPKTNGSSILGADAPAVLAPATGAAVFDGFTVSLSPTEAQTERSVVMLNGAGSLTLRRVFLPAGAAPQVAEQLCSVHLTSSSTGSLTIESESDIEAGAADKLSAGACIDGDGEVIIKSSSLRGGKAVASAGLVSQGSGALTVSQSVFAGSEGVAQCWGVRLRPAKTTASATFISTSIKAGVAPQTTGVEAVGLASLFLQGGSVSGEGSGEAGSESLGLLAEGVAVLDVQATNIVGEASSKLQPTGSRGVGVRLTNPGGVATSAKLQGAQITGATSTDERVGVEADGVSLQVIEGQIAGSLVPGGRRAVGVWLAGSPAGPLRIEKTTRIAGGSPSTSGLPYEAYGVEVLAANKVEILENLLIEGCSPSCSADLLPPNELAQAAGVRLRGGQGHDVRNNEKILGGPRASGANAALTRHAGVHAEPSCGAPPCPEVGLSLATNQIIAGNLSSSLAPDEVFGLLLLDSTFSVQNNDRLQGGYGVERAVAVEVRRVDGVGSGTSLVLGNRLSGGVAGEAVGLLSKRQKALLISGNLIEACGLKGGIDPAVCGAADASFGVISHDDTNTTFSNNYIFGGFGAEAVGCEVANGGVAPDQSAAQFLYNLCVAQGRAKTPTDAVSLAVGFRVASLGGQASGFVFLDNIFGTLTLATSRYPGVESPGVGDFLLQHNDFLPLATVGAGVAYYLRQGVEVDSMPELNTLAPSFSGNLSIDPVFSASNYYDVSKSGFHLDPKACALRNQGLPSAVVNKDIDGEERGSMPPDDLPEIGPDECPPP